MKNNNTRLVTGVAMVVALAYVVMLLGFHFMPSAPFLKYEAKDVVLTIGGYIFGPFAALAAAFTVALIEMVTVSDTGPIGFLMNFLAAAAYAGLAALLYQKRRTAAGAIIGLVGGTLLMTVVMLLWNYLITPIYMETPREVVAGMLFPVFLPFNLIKGGLNMGLILLLYKPLMKALRVARLLPESHATAARLLPGARANAPSADGAPADSTMISAKADGNGPSGSRVNVSMLLCAALVLLVCFFAIYLLRLK